MLMDLPVIGSMFGKTSDDYTSTEIAILITPHIVKGKEDYDKLKGTIKPFKPYSTDKQL